jgi:hypothetical protein
VSGGSFGKVRAQVAVTKGSVSCTKARRVVRDLFSGRSCYQDNGATYNSYWKVPGGWRGSARMNYYVLSRGHLEVSGSSRKIGGRTREPPIC